jgi:hypothetical protein
MRSRMHLLLMLAPLLLVACTQTTAPNGPDGAFIIGERPAPTITTLSDPATLYAQLDNLTTVYVGGGFDHPEWIVADEFYVPSGEGWTITEVGFPSLARLVMETYTLTFFAANASEPGLPGPVVSQQTYGIDDTSSRDGLVIVPLPTTVALASGTYWIGIDGFYVNVRVPYTGHPAVRGDAVVGSFHEIDLEGFGGVDEPVDLAFALFGVSTPASVTAQDVIDAFDAWVADDELSAWGPAKSAAHRLDAFRNMLLQAQFLIDVDDDAGACVQLTDAQRRIHIGGPLRPSHFVTGPKAGGLYDLIEDLKAAIGCG